MKVCVVPNMSDIYIYSICKLYNRNLIIINTVSLSLSFPCLPHITNTALMSVCDVGGLILYI